MARAFCGERVIHAGLIAGPRFDDEPFPAGIEWIDAAHPYPDALSERAGVVALDLAARAHDAGTLIVLLSGGASSMLAAPSGVTIADKAAAAKALMAAGVGIDGLNCVRKHLSSIKGGWLGAAAGTCVTLALSDVHAPLEDDPAVIGSGPTTADPTTFSDALEVIERSGARVPAAVIDRLASGARGEVAETPKRGDPRLADCVFHIIGTRRTAMAGAESAARRLGYSVVVVERPIAGEAREAGRDFVRAARAACARSSSICVIAAGETTVTVRGDGRGGRNQEFVLGALDELGGPGELVLGSVGTDGIDGSTPAAGAIGDARSRQRARARGLDADAALRRNDAYSFFSALDDLVHWGPTGTNVGDVHVLLSRTG
jgi:glycerate-2-kinase